MNTKDVGDISEAQVLAAFLRSGETILMPFGDNKRYDLVLDRGGQFVRVQVKTGRIRNGAVHFKTCSSDRDARVACYLGEADLFAVYCPGNHRVYVIPVEVCGLRECTLRLEPEKSRQYAGVRAAADYEYPKGQ